MASDTKESSGRNSGPVEAGLSFGDGAPDNTSAASGNPQDQMLLQALQDFILPLIQGQNNMMKMDLGPEAGKLLTALREFISSIVMHSQSDTRKMIEVSWVEGKTELEGSINDEERENDYDSDNDKQDEELSASSVKESLMERPPAEAVGDATDEQNSVGQGNPEPTFRDKVLSALREHVFNRMPIRLLSFEPHGSSFQIALLERGDIYARLVLALPEKLDEPDHHRETDSGSDEDHQEQAIWQLLSKHARYAILSHTWLHTTPGEITYGDWNKGQFDENGPGYNKLVNFCQTAWKDHRLPFGWMDTICINKDSSSELDESIRSMYKWYQCADVCIVYLADTGTLQTMHNDPWFTRGWTLQEMLAPQVIKFYNMDWKRFSESVNDKPEQWKPIDIYNANASKILENIERATTITANELEYGVIISPISRRMQMAANRKVTREEDTAYSLMGIFDVSIATAYGEGAKRAFSRLLQAILMTYEYGVMDMFNWAGYTNLMLNSQLLPDSPQNYVNRSPNVALWMPMEPLTLTHMGLRIPVILMPAISTSDSNFEYHPIGAYKATANCYLSDDSYWFISDAHHLLDKRCSGPDGEKDDGLFQTTFAVLNFDRGKDSTINIPKTCFAMALKCSEDAGKVSTSGLSSVYGTTKPIVFDLEKSAIVDENEGDVYEFISGEEKQVYHIKIAELPNHGMQLVTLYL